MGFRVEEYLVQLTGVHTDGFSSGTEFERNERNSSRETESKRFEQARVLTRAY